MIATEPTSQRDASRLLVLGRTSGHRTHARFADLPDLLPPRALLVLNDTRVIRARLHGSKPTGGAVELFLVRRLPSGEGSEDADPSDRWHEEWEILTRGLGPEGRIRDISCAEDLTVHILWRGPDGAAHARFSGRQPGGVLGAAERFGQLPLPPYIEAARRRLTDPPTVDDDERYQTVFARVPGAVAAPTAGLHFTPALLERIESGGHEVISVTLHVGPGTFRPVKVEDPRQHEMDAEWYDIAPAARDRIAAARAEGRPIVAVGTTVVRALESAAREGWLPGARATKLFLLPGARFEVVTDLITNFHLPRSTLLMLVAAFAGRQSVLDAYREAVEEGYRFYSYGDAMFIRAEGPSP